MKKTLKTKITSILAVSTVFCAGVAFANNTKTDKVSDFVGFSTKNVYTTFAEVGEGEDVLGATKYTVSTDGNYMLVATAIKNWDLAYEVGYTGLTQGDNTTQKCFGAISDANGSITAQELFGEAYDAMIVWEVNYDATQAYSFNAYAKIGYYEDGQLYAYDTEKVVNKTTATIEVQHTHSYGTAVKAGVGVQVKTCECGDKIYEASDDTTCDFTASVYGAKLLAPDGTDVSNYNISETNTNPKLNVTGKGKMAFHLYESLTLEIVLPQINFTKFEAVYIPFSYAQYYEEMGIGFTKDTIVNTFTRTDIASGVLQIERVSDTSYKAKVLSGTKSTETTITDTDVLSGANSLSIFANGKFAVERILTLGDFVFVEKNSNYIATTDYENVAGSLKTGVANSETVYGMPTTTATYTGYHFRPDEPTATATDVDFSNAKEAMFGFKATKDVAHMMNSDTYVAVPKNTWAFVKAVNETDGWKVYMSIGNPFGFTEQPKLTTLFASRNKNLKQLFDFLSWENIEYTVTATNLYVKGTTENTFSGFLASKGATKVANTAIPDATLQTEKLDGENWYKYSAGSIFDNTTNLALDIEKTYIYAMKLSDGATMGSGNPAVGVKLEKEVLYYVTFNWTAGTGWVVSLQTKYGSPVECMSATETFTQTNFKGIVRFYLTQYSDMWSVNHPIDIYVTGVYTAESQTFSQSIANEIASWGATKLQDNAMSRGEKESYTLGGQNVYKATSVENGALGADIAINTYNEVYFMYKSPTENTICGGGNPYLKANTWYYIKVVKDGDNFVVYKKACADADFTEFKTIPVTNGQWFVNDFNVYNWTENVSGNMVVYSLGIWTK